MKSKANAPTTHKVYSETLARMHGINYNEKDHTTRKKKKVNQHKHTYAHKFNLLLFYV